MKKALLITSLFVVSSLMLFNMAHAASAGLGFGGIIETEEALEITTLEAGGYTCAVPGDTFDIIPYGKSPNGPYLAVIPPVTQNAAVPGKWVLGLYSLTPTIITCIHESPYVPPTTVNLYPITIFGVSL